jgi:hypothetical protein
MHDDALPLTNLGAGKVNESPVDAVTRALNSNGARAGSNRAVVVST